MKSLSGLTLIDGCVSLPTGPSVMALPGSGKTFDQFRVDDAECREFALSQASGTTAEQVATDAAMLSAVLGTVFGTVAGAAIGGRHGADVGAGTGLLVGSMAGAGTPQTSAYGTQRRYDNAYVQCMYASVEHGPVAGMRPKWHAAPQRVPLDSYPPPPPGSPPPPPPER